MRKSGIIGVNFFVVFLSLVSCRLINSEEDAWAKAANLKVSVAYPLEWGISPQMGTDRCFDAVRTNETPRKGYPFNVEFIPTSSYGFVEWLAFNSNDYTLAEIVAMSFEVAVENSLKDKGIKITVPVETHIGSMISTVTITINDEVMLVPFCGTRPQVIMSNPPLTNSYIFYSPHQPITIYFSQNLDYEPNIPITDFFGEGFIQINGQYIDELDNLDNGNSDLTEHFYAPVYNDYSRTITIYPIEDALPFTMNITVTVGTKIQAINKLCLSAPVSFSYFICSIPFLQNKFDQYF